MKLTIEDLPAIVLSCGFHDNPNEGMCLLEAASLFAGEDFSDHPACVDPVIAAFGRAWNDGMRTDKEREQLKQYIPLIVGTNKGAALSEKRAWMAADWLIREHAVAFLSLTPSLAHHAEALKNLPPITCSSQEMAAQPVIEAAKKDAVYAADVVMAYTAAGDAAAVAARAAAGDAARDAAIYAAGDAVWTVDDAAVAARVAARVAANKVLEPTVKTLQESAHELLTRMINADLDDAMQYETEKRK